MSISNCWTGIQNEMVKWKMEWNGECIQLWLTCVTDTVQSIYYISLTVEAASASPVLPAHFFVWYHDVWHSQKMHGASQNWVPYTPGQSAAGKQLMASYSTLHGGQAYYCQGRLLQRLWELGMIDNQGAQMRIKVKRLKIEHWFSAITFLSTMAFYNYSLAKPDSCFFIYMWESGIARLP